MLHNMNYSITYNLNYNVVICLYCTQPALYLNLQYKIYVERLFLF